MSRLIVCGLLSLLCPMSHAFGNNNYFIPGDAFFYFEIDQAEWEAFKAGENTIWKYDRPEHLPRMLCGYAGYLNLDTSTLSPEYRTRLIEAVEEMKKRYPTKIVEREISTGFFDQVETRQVELNKIRVFVYNRDFDFSKYRLALKYNEDWPGYAQKTGHSRQHFQYDFFVDSPKAIIESWRLGEQVPGLNAALPPLTRGAVKKPIPFETEKFNIVLAPPVAFEQLAFPEKESKLECLMVSQDATRRMKVVKREWQVQND